MTQQKTPSTWKDSFFLATLRVCRSYCDFGCGSAALGLRGEMWLLGLSAPLGSLPFDGIVKFIHFHQLISITPLTIIAALRTIRIVTRSTSRKNSALKINEKNGPVLLMGITTETLPRSRA